MSESLPDLLRQAMTLQRQGRTVTACLLVRARGSTPQSAGALMLVDDASGIYGTIGGGCVEAEVRQQAFTMLGADRTGLLQFKLDHDYGWDDGLICGGSIEIAVGRLPKPEQLEGIIACIEERRETALEIEVDLEGRSARFRLRLPPRERLLIAGAGHIGLALTRLALLLDFEVTVFDDRVDLLDRISQKGARCEAGPIAECLAATPIDGNTFCLIATRGHRHDAQALGAVLGRGARFIGMIGSRRKVKVIREDLLARGASAEQLDQVKSPVGLDIGSVSVQEIALSIAAQLVQVRRETAVGAVEGPEPVAESSEARAVAARADGAET